MIRTGSHILKVDSPWSKFDLPFFDLILHYLFHVGPYTLM